MLYKLKNIAPIVMLVSILQSGAACAQSPQQIMSGIYKSYESATYLTFDVKFMYQTDTVNSDFTDDVLAGTYTMAGKKAKYNLGDIDFMQNDSFLISIYNKEKIIIVADPPNKNVAKDLPMRAQIDSLFKNYTSYYTITTSATEEIGTINFAKADERAQFENFLIAYHPDQNILLKVEYRFKEMMAVDDTSAAQLRNRKLSIEFSNYRYDNLADNLYDENNYIFFEGGECKPVKKYKDYKVFYSRAAALNN